MGLSIDATVTGTAVATDTTLTTGVLACTKVKDLILVYTYVGILGSPPVVTGVEDSGHTLTFTKRYPTGSPTGIECWWAWGPTTSVFSDSIVVTFAGALPHQAICVVEAITGADPSGPWDADGSLPSVATGNIDHSVTAPVATVSSGETMCVQFGAGPFGLGVWGFYATVGPGSPGAPNEIVATSFSPDGAIFANALAGLIPSGPVSLNYGVSAGVDSTGSPTWPFATILADVVVADPTIPPGPPGVTGPYGQMYLPMPSQWADAIESTVLRTTTYAEIWSGMKPGAGGFDNHLLIRPQWVTGGSVTIDRANAIRRSATNITLLPDPAGELLPIVNAAPTSDTSLFAPYGAEMRLYKGISVPGTTPASVTSLFPPSWDGPSFPMPPYICSAGVNDTFYLTRTGHAAELFTVAPGTYPTWSDIVAAIMAATGSVSSEAFSTYVTVTTNGVALTFTMADGSGAAGNANTMTTGPTDALYGFGLYSPATFSGGADVANIYANLGVFMIEDVDVVNDANGVTLVGTLKDRAQWVARHSFTAPYSTDGVSTIDQAIAQILLATVGSSGALPFLTAFTSTFNVPPVTTHNIGDDPWQACSDLAASCGFQLYFDYQGVCVFCPIPDPSVGVSCITYTEGTSSAMTTLKRVISNSSIPNVICVTSQGSGVNTPVQVFWWDSDPASPAYYAAAPTGDFSTPVTTLASADPSSIYPTSLKMVSMTVIGPASQLQQAQNAANAAGTLAVGSLENTTVTIRDNPAQDVDDIITLGRVRAGIPTSTNYVVDHVQIDLGVTAGLSLTARPVQ